MATRNPSLNIRPELAASSGAPGGAAHSASEAELHGPRGPWWWTGKTPEECPGFDADSGTLKSLAMPPTTGFTRQQVLDYFDNCWTLTEVLFAALQVRQADAACE